MFVKFIFLYLLLEFGSVALNNQMSIIKSSEVSDSKENKLAQAKEGKASRQSFVYAQKSSADDENGYLEKLAGTYVHLASSVIVEDKGIPNIPGEESLMEHMARNKKKERQYLDLGDHFTLDDLKIGLKALKLTTGKKKAKKANRKDYRDVKVVLEELGQYDFSKKTYENIIGDFLVNYTRSDMDNKISVLTEIEFLVHQYSVAHDFVKMGGIKMLLHDIVTFKNTSFQALAAMTLGSAMQGNPPVKQVVLKSNAIPLFLNLLESLDPVLQSRVLYAISCLLRQYPEAQKKFIVEGGFSTLARLSATTQSAKIVKKIMILIYDLLSENKFDEDDAEKSQNIDLITEIHLRKTQLEQTLQQNSFCNFFTTLMSTDYSEAIEILVQTMHYLKNICKKEFIQNISTLKILAAKYHSQIDSEVGEKSETGFKEEFSDDLHFSPLFTTLSKIISELELLSKDEL